MKNKIRQIELAMEEASRQEMQVATELNEATQLLEHQKNYLQSLYAQQTQYRLKIHEPDSNIQANVLHEYCGALNDLDRMISVQIKMINSVEERIIWLRDEWSLKNTKLMALEQVLFEYRKAQIVTEEASEQSNLEEQTLRHLYRSEDVLD